MNQSFHGDFAGPRGGDDFYKVLNRVMIVAIIFILLTAGSVAFIPLFRQSHKETLELERLRAEIARKKLTVLQSRRDLGLLRNDPTYIELKARDRLDLMKPGETIVRLDSMPSPAPIRPHP